MTVPVSRPTSAKSHRFKGLRRWVVVYVCAVVSLVALWLWWPYEVRRQVRAEIASLQARGEPVQPEDFDSEPLPDDQNAAVLYQQAMACLTLTTAQWEFINNFPSDVPLTPAECKIADGILAANGESLRLAHIARGRRGAYWGQVHPHMLSLYNAGRPVGYELAKVLYLAAERSVGEGDHAEAVRHWRGLSHFANALRAIPVLTIPDQEATRVLGCAIVQVERHAPALLVQTHSVGASDPQAADPADLRALIRDLLADESWHAAHVRVWQANRAANLNDALRGWVAPDPLAPIGWQVLQRVFWPVERMDALRLARFSGETVDGIRDAPNYGVAKNLLPTRAARVRSALRSRVERAVHWRTDGWGYGTAEYAQATHYEDMADRHLAAASLAIRLYRRDHEGQWPENLDQLVPDYLPNVPSDPLAAGAGIKMSRLGARQILYSVGRNGIDDGGSARSRFTRPITLIGSDRWNCADGIMFREPAPPPPAPGQSPSRSINPETTE